MILLFGGQTFILSHRDLVAAKRSASTMDYQRINDPSYPSYVGSLDEYDEELFVVPRRKWPARPLSLSLARAGSSPSEMATKQTGRM